MTGQLNHFIQSLKEGLGLNISIGLGVFLFVLFFQPFAYESLDYENRILFTAGLGAIVFLVILIIRVLTPWLLRNYSEKDPGKLLHPNIPGFSILIISSVAFAFYLQYVGEVQITFYTMLKVVLICLAPPVILRRCDIVQELKDESATQRTIIKNLQMQLDKYRTEKADERIELISETGSENIQFSLHEILFIRSADNYVEAAYREGEDFEKKLLRATLRNIEQQLKHYPEFIRCHRSCIVNAEHIEKLYRKNSSYWISLKDSDTQLPVSRQYLLKVRELSPQG